MFPAVRQLCILIDIRESATHDSYFGPDPKNTSSYGARSKVNSHFAISKGYDSKEDYNE